MQCYNLYGRSDGGRWEGVGWAAAWVLFLWEWGAPPIPLAFKATFGSESAIQALDAELNALLSLTEAMASLVSSTSISDYITTFPIEIHTWVEPIRRVLLKGAPNYFFFHPKAISIPPVLSNSGEHSAPRRVKEATGDVGGKTLATGTTTTT